MEKRKCILGLDIGVGSVGFGLIDEETNEVLEAGARLFEESTAEENENRRNKRHLRRLIRRKALRIKTVREILIKSGFIDNDFEGFNNVYELRKKGIEEKITKEEFAACVLHFAKRSGYKYSIIDEEEDDSEIKAQKHEYVVEDQLERLNNDGKVRGIDNRFHESSYVKEFEKLCEIQQIDDELKERLKEVIFRRRDYSEGPGSSKSPSKYGRYISFGAEPINLIDKMRGYCSIYNGKDGRPKELRAPAMSFSAELFNFLNDLNNLSFRGEKLDSEQKEILVEIIKEKGTLTPKQLIRQMEWIEDEVDGFRIDKNEKPILTEFKGYKKLRSVFKENNISNELLKDSLLVDKIIDILTKTKIKEEREEALQKLEEKQLTKALIDSIASIKGVSGYHALSFKALREMNEIMLEENKNQQQIRTDSNWDSFSGYEVVGGKLKLTEEAVLNPVAKRSINETFKVVHAIEKKYGEISSIVIEMAREKNSKEKQNEINERQRYFDNQKKEAEELLKTKMGEGVEINAKTLLKVRLYKEQECKSLYSGKEIDLNRLVNDPDYCEVDHIIPLSVSFDDSYKNKTLCLKGENADKGQRTPYAYLKNSRTGTLSWETFSSLVKSNRNLSNKKKQNYLNQDDINKSKVREDFILRNLNDTRYACRFVLNALKDYYSKKEQETKVCVVNGSMTSHFRSMAGLKEKDRSYYCHHAIDALIIASMKKSIFTKVAMEFLDDENGELLTVLNNEKIYDPEIVKFVKELDHKDPIADFSFSYKVDKKPNRCISDDTLYGTIITDGVIKIIGTHKDIYGKNGEKFAKDLRSNNEKNYIKYLMFEKDLATFSIIKKIVDSYPNEKNPFAAYKEEHGFIKKYTKNGDGPVIRNVRYIDKKVNECLDLTHKMKKTNRKEKVVIKKQLSSFRMDLFRNTDGRYLFIPIKYANIKQKGKKYYIDEKWYKNLKEERKIENNAAFIGSFYRGDLIKIKKEDENERIFVYKCIKNSDTNQIEVALYGCDTKAISETERCTPTISKDTVLIEKIVCDELGKQYKEQNPVLKLEL